MQKNQKFWKLLVIISIFGLLFAASALAGEKTISGTVENSDQGVIISADDGMTYMVKGKDLSDMVGKSVKATGMLEEGSSGVSIQVTMVEEVKMMKE